jgi:prepilin-type N-terminal cleavage/methylation domain-containing protein
MMSRIGRRSFTLIEVLVCVAILSAGIIFVFESFFTCLNAFGRYANYLNVFPWMNEKLWQAEDEIVRQQRATFLENQGEFESGGKTFYWQLTSNLVDKDAKLYRLDLTVSWQEANKKRELRRQIYAIRK